MKENFSKRVQTIMKFAKEEAIQLGHSYVGSEHLMLGIVSSDFDQYSDIIAEVDVIYEYCIEATNDCGPSLWSCDDGFLGIGALGDINLDSTLNVLDVVLLLNFILEIEYPNQDQIWLSDINSDTILNILDIIALVNIILS